MKKLLLIPTLFAILLFAGCGQQSIQPPPIKTITAAAYDAVEAKTKGVWDKKIEIDVVNASQKAVRGFWWAKDRWDWIAWQKDDGTWNVLVSMDGFDCKELDTIPSQYMSFFSDEIYRTFDAPVTRRRYCY